VEKNEARERLAKLRDEFTSTVNTIKEQTADRELDLSRVAMFEARLRQIDDAFDRLRQGSYGICVDCGQPIRDDRLRLVPDTPYCVKDAQREQARAQ